jgi:starch synthase (maltosyl-transferring)
MKHKNDFSPAVAEGHDEPGANVARTEPSEGPVKGSGVAGTAGLETVGEGRARVVIEGICPEIDGGKYPIKRVVGDSIIVEADIFADGHDRLSAVLCYREAGAQEWSEAPMKPLVNDRWRGEFRVSRLGIGHYTIEGWIDAFESWRQDTQKKVQANQDVAVELLAGARLIEEAAARAEQADRAQLEQWAQVIRGAGKAAMQETIRLALSDEVAMVVARYPDRRFASRYERELPFVVDPLLARFGAWYEMFPRSCPERKAWHGTFQDVEAHLARIAQMGFDILYFPPIHPIGRAFRKGKNNSRICEPGEPGSPWAIGSEEGGHKSIHPELGTLEDFRRLVGRARDEYKVEIALDLAYQCAPDHPYVREHPEWFKKRPDGSIQYAENPPKKYQDIYPLDFECEDWADLWRELKSVVDFWIEQGVRVFRVDNPHTKALRFWEWLIAGVKAARPEVIFLAEAFTRPKLLYRLAKLGFSQSYNYFPWRNTRHELAAYLTELTQPPVSEFCRPNLWPNTPDILTQYLQYGGPPAFKARLILAATLGASYGIYGPAFELCVNQAREPGSEEYLASEKYEIKSWDLSSYQNLSDLIQRVNRIRHENPALQLNQGLRFHPTDNDQFLAYSKRTPDLSNLIVTVVNLDSHYTQRGWLDFSPSELGVAQTEQYQMHDLLTDARYLWRGSHNYIELNPAFIPAHIFRVRQRVRTEQDFDYYL